MSKYQSFSHHYTINKIHLAKTIGKQDIVYSKLLFKQMEDCTIYLENGYCLQLILSICGNFITIIAMIIISTYNNAIGIRIKPPFFLIHINTTNNILGNL